jgi:shikimate dehydrogenase
VVDLAERARLGSPVDAATRLFFIVGHPVDHVRAPVVWSALMRRHGVNAVFLPADVRPEAVDAGIRGLKAMQNVDGLMFTMPHKVAAMAHADTLSERARRVGSINLLRPHRDGSWEGDNVDGAGFIAGLADHGIAVRGRRAYVHGAGGVGANIAWSLAAEAPQSIAIFDLDTARARALARAIADATGVAAAAGAPDLARIDLAVNASPLGLNPADPLPFDVARLPSGAAVADVVMDPVHTALLKAAAARGLVTHHGRHMMNYAMPLAAAFFGLPADVDWNGGPLQNPAGA